MSIVEGLWELVWELFGQWLANLVLWLLASTTGLVILAMGLLLLAMLFVGNAWVAWACGLGAAAAGGMALFKSRR
jgi:hypothetical protein